MKNLKLVLVLMGLALLISFCGKKEGMGDNTIAPFWRKWRSIRPRLLGRYISSFCRI